MSHLPVLSTRRRRLLALLIGLALLGSACGDDDETTADESGGDDETPADLQLVDSGLGEIIADAGGNTLYLFLPDAQGESTCYDQCEINWPVVRELATVGEGLDAGLLGTVERTDGNVQATYDGWPLYRFINDAAPGDTNGQGLNDAWYVIDAEGSAIGAG